MTLTIYTDGGARGNPGPAAVGVVVRDHTNTVLRRHKRYIGHATNNVAEYTAVLDALAIAHELDASIVHFYCDSELIVKQLRGEYRVKDATLKGLYAMVSDAAASFSRVVYTHIPRDKNKDADALVNAALDAHV
jgi:ribonuclease HI